MVAPVSAAVKSAALDQNGWSAAQFADAALLLLDSKLKAVPQEQMERKLGSHITNDVSQQQLAGVPVLEALVKADRLSLRPMSCWPLNISHEAGFADGAVLVDYASILHGYYTCTTRTCIESMAATKEGELSASNEHACTKHVS
jgi:hypothetical protein